MRWLPYRVGDNMENTAHRRGPRNRFELPECIWNSSRSIYSCVIHVRMEGTWVGADYIVYGGQTTVADNVWRVSLRSSFSFSLFGEIEDGHCRAVIEILKDKKMQLRHAHNLWANVHGKARNVRDAVKFLFIPLTRQLQALDTSRAHAAADVRLFFLHVHVRVQAACD